VVTQDLGVEMNSFFTEYHGVKMTKREFQVGDRVSIPTVNSTYNFDTDGFKNIEVTRIKGTIVEILRDKSGNECFRFRYDPCPPANYLDRLVHPKQCRRLVKKEKRKPREFWRAECIENEKRFLSGECLPTKDYCDSVFRLVPNYVGAVLFREVIEGENEST
jgi:hypothetical protein